MFFGGSMINVVQGQGSATGFQEKAIHAWENFTPSERIIFFGAVGMFVSYFLPWLTVSSWNGTVAAGGGTGILFPLAASVFSCFKLYRSQGATAAKRIRARRWQIGIGAWGTVSSLFVLFLANNTGLFTANVVFTPGLGLYLCAVASIAVLVGALILKKELRTDADGLSAGSSKNSFCVHCGSKLEENSAFCAACGGKI
jgi:hypothetical protein